MHKRRFLKQITLSLWNVCKSFLSKWKVFFIYFNPSLTHIFSGRKHFPLNVSPSARKCLFLIFRHTFPYFSSCFWLSSYFCALLKKICLYLLCILWSDIDKEGLPEISPLKAEEVQLPHPDQMYPQKILLSCRLGGFRLEEPSTSHFCITHLLEHILPVILNNLKEKKNEYALRGGQRWNKNW